MEPNVPVTREEEPGKIVVGPEVPRTVEITVSLTISPESVATVRRLLYGEPLAMEINRLAADGLVRLSPIG